MQTTIRTLLIILAAFAFALLFWPGVYQYGQTHNGILVRVHRFAGKTEHYNAAGLGWAAPQPVPTPTLNYIDPFSGKPSLDSFGRPISGNSADK